MPLNTYYGFFDGILTTVSKRGDYGFVDLKDLAHTKGYEELPTPTDSVFVHVKEVPFIDELFVGMPLTFGVHENREKPGKFEADSVIVPPRFVGIVTLPTNCTDYGFVRAESMRFAPESEYDLGMPRSETELPGEDVFVHRYNIRKGMGTRLTNHAEVAFYAATIPQGRHKGKLKAADVVLL